MPVIYSDDTDASWDFTVTSRDDETVDWATPTIAIDTGSYTVTGTWQGSPSSSRVLRVPLVSLAVGEHRLYLRVPNGADLFLGTVNVVARR